MRILIVDDEPATGLLLQSIIKEVPGVITDIAHILAEKYEDLSLVFATAHPDHALEAFELYSVDYILKPFD